MCEAELDRLTALDGCASGADGTVEGVAIARFARGVRRLQAAVVPGNAPVIALLRSLPAWARWRRDGWHLLADIPLPEPARPLLTRPLAERRVRCPRDAVQAIERGGRRGTPP